MAKNKTDYFQMIQEQVAYTNRAAHMLADVLERFDPETLDHDRQELHIIERQADLKAHDIQDRLIKEFITPIDREDLAELVQMIDTITDSLDDVLIRAYIYNVRTIPMQAKKFCKIIVSSADTLTDLAAELSHFRKSDNVRDKIVKMNMFVHWKLLSRLPIFLIFIKELHIGLSASQPHFAYAYIFNSKKLSARLVPYC